jgi:hypothetical protein
MSLGGELLSRRARIEQIDDEITRLKAEQDVCRVEIIEIEKLLDEM